MNITYRTKFNISLSTVIVCSFFLFNKFNLNFKELKPDLKIEKITLNYNFLKVFNLGSPRIISSYLWMLSLLQSDLEHTERDTRSWLYHRINAISELDPYFLENYINGGLYLSIINDDLYGADKIFTKGLNYFHDNKLLLWYKGFNLCFELGKCLEALATFQKLELVRKSNEFTLTSRIISKIQAQEGLLELSYQTLLNLYKNTESEVLKLQIYKSLYSVKATIDLNCLNSRNNENCNKVDLSGNYYLKNSAGKFYSKEAIIEKALGIKKGSK